MVWFIVDLAAALCIAGLSGMGVGSGGLFVIYLTLLRGAPQLAAQGWNLLFYLFAAGASLAVHIRRRDLRWGLIAILAGGGLAGAYFGSALAPMIDPALLRRLFGGMLVASGCVVLLRRDRQTKSKTKADLSA